jgi:hypothetical protein
VVFRLLPEGFANRDLRALLARLLGVTPGTLTSGSLTYQLRRLQLHGFITRIDGTHRYRVTDGGLRTALFFTRVYARVLRPGLAHVPPAPRLPALGFATPSMASKPRSIAGASPTRNSPHET